MKIKFLTVIVLTFLKTFLCDERFYREELGYADRLRFTSGLHRLYNCTVVNNRLVSNLKIGIYTHETHENKVSINYTLNDTSIYILTTAKVEDFYFAIVNVNGAVRESNKVIELTASDTNTGNVIDRTLLYIYVKEDHNLPPVFDSNSKTISLYDDLFLGSIIGKITLKKAYSDAILYIDETNVSLVKEFSVSVDGRIILIKSLNAAIKSYFEFYVNARFPDSRLYSSIRVSIHVKPGLKPQKPVDRTFRNIIPQQSSSGGNSYTSHLLRRDYVFSVSELAPKSTVVGSLDINIPDVNFLIADGDPAGIFQIDFKTGVLFIQDSQHLDYEKVVSYKFSITGFIKNEIRVLEAQVLINVTDENDHEPEFTEDRYAVSIKEYTSAFTSILKVTAFDKDDGNNGKVSYVISNDIKIPFVVDDDGILMLSEPPLFPKMRSKYYVYITALDWGKPFRNEKEVTVEVNIQPVNSHSPVLKQQACNFVLSDASSSLFTFTAIDQDFNDKIQYKMESIHAGFTINSTSGVLSYVPQPGHTETMVYISAYDGMHESKVSVLNVKFSKEEGEKVCVDNKDFFLIKDLISEINKPFPLYEKLPSTKSVSLPLKFKETPGPTVNVLEDVPVNSKIGLYSTNIDCCFMVLYSIESGNKDFNFRIDPLNGTLYVLRPLDRELFASHKLTIKASGLNGESVMSLLTVNVLDVNDNVPIFTNNGTYTVYVHEDWQIGRKIVTVEAIDLDLNTDIEYSLVNPSRMFKIDSKTGEVSLLSSLSDEIYIEYFIQVQASERSLIQDNQGFALIHIIVSELINNPPVCLTNNQHISVPTDSPVGVIVGRMFGYDSDQGENGKLVYTVSGTKQQNQFGDYIDSNIFSNYFSMDENSGLIQLVKTLPSTFEKFEVNTLLEDGGKPKLKVTCKMYVSISEGFGNIKPVFTHTEMPLIVIVPESTPLASNITEVYAKIPGRHIGEGIKYVIIDGNGILDFTMKNEHSGKITNKNSHFSRKSYWLTVQAQLESNPSIFTNTHILIRIKSVKVERPYIYPTVQFLTVAENIPVGSKIIQLHTLSSGVYIYNKNNYSFQSGNEDKFFSIDEVGNLFVQQKLVVGQYDLNITITSASNSFLFSYGSVHVTVEHDDSPPDFNMDFMANIQVFETKGSLHPPYLFQVLAENKHPENLLVFKNLGASSIFSVNPTTGVVTTNNTLVIGQEDYLTIAAKNSKGQSITENFIGITVIERPKTGTFLVFKNKSYYVSIDENKKGELIDFDKEIDKTTTGPVFFYILSGNEKQKFLFPLRFISKLYVINPLDFEQQQQHKLRILAFDGKAFAETELIIFVINLNDNTPSASQACYEASVKEGFRHLKERILSVKVIDPDNLNPDFKYQTINNFDDSFPFSVGENDGSIMVQPVELDRELKSEYLMTVVASNAVEQTAFCVQISLEDTNDNKPLFTSDVYDITIVDTAPIHSTIMVVYAVDKDIGSNGKVSYSFVENNNYFDVDPKYGFIYVKMKLNELSGQIVNLKLAGKDNGVPELIGYAYVKISIVADPNNIWFKVNNLTVSVSENIAPGTMLLDKIRVESTSINYEIAEKDDDCYTLFWIEPFTGSVFVKSDLDFEKTTQCAFKLNGVLNQKVVTTIKVLVNILDRNDNIPLVKDKSYIGSVSEGLSSNSNILDKDGNSLIVSATDEDQGVNGMLRYSIIGNIGKIYFMIDEVSGEIRTNKVLDYELHPRHFSFFVKVSDQGLPQHSVIVPVSIYLKDINDKIPSFKKHYTFTVNLPVFRGTVVGRVEAFDEDTVPNVPLQYSLLYASAVLDINQFTGVIYVKDESSLTSPAIMKLEVAVGDGTFKGKTNVKIETKYYKPDETFKFLDEIYNANVLENVDSFTIVKVINPVGYKRSENLHFRILNTVPGFEIIENVGAIVTDFNSKFDHENVKFYVLHIEAIFNNVYARTSLNVTVVDVNDHAPVFEQKKYFHPVNIETKKGTVLLKVTAHDADSGENGKVRYSMLTKDNYFSCDSITGEVVLVNEFIKSLTKPIYTLIIEASDNGTNVLSSKTYLEIPVLNEDQPKFTKSYEATVDEDIGQGSSLFTVVAYGPQNRQVFYQLYDGDEFEVFEIGLTTGELKVAGNLDYEQRNSYKLQVKAIDCLSGSWALTDCEINLNDVNDNPPMFEKPFYKMFLKEDVKPGTVAGTVNATDLDKDLNSLIRYSIKSADEGSFFIVNPSTGDIATTKVLDADVKSEYFLQITASDQGEPSKLTSVTVQIILIDINDNKPIFSVPKYYFYVEKFVQSKQFIGKVVASDLDSNTKLSYVLSKTSSIVKIDLFTGVLYLTGIPLPMTSILLEVMASDGLHVAFAEVVIDCLARNDYRPLVLEQIDVIITENTIKNALLVDINPIDRDKGIYANVSYQIDSQTAAKYFSVNEFGKIYSTGHPLDSELIQQLVIPVRVTDDGGLFSIIQVVVTIEDQNDNTPIFEYPSYQATIVNSQITDDSLLQVFASDPDRGSNSELFYVAQGLREDNVPIFIDGRSGLISLSGTPKGSMYQFSVRVTDNGYPVQKSDTKVFIYVKSWNEEVLRFNVNVYHVTISEDAPINSHLITVNAFLQGYNDTLTYSLVDGNLPHTNASQFFKLHPTTGQIKIRSPLNYEVLQRHKLLILVVSKKGDTSTCYVEVNVTNVNDNAPKFHSSTYSFKIAEDTEVGERLIRVSAYDLDELYTESSLVYSIVSENKVIFQVDKTTGWLSLKKQLDREIKASHEVLIVATDVDGKFDSTTVQITLVDVNDSPPVFLNEVYIVTVKEDALVGQTLRKINAVDPDLNQKIEYFLISSSSENFAIDSQSGNIYLLRQLTQAFYNFTTVAYDGIHIGKADIWVKVQDFNNHSPICLLTFYEASVEENSDVDKEILQIKAEDEDPSDILKYQIHGDAHGKFVVNETTGILKASSYLDFEIETRYRFKVVVIDLVGHTCTSDIFIKVIDINDNSPAFLQPLYKATLRENATYGVVVTQVKAFDKDSLKNGQVSYSLLNNIRDTFKIHSQGIITVNKPLEIQPSTRYNLTVIGTDHGTPSYSSNTKVEIIVLSNSDSPPQFDKFSYLFNVTENNEQGIVIGKIKVTGTTNFDMYAIVIEFIDPLYESLFSIEDNGNLKVLKVLDYEEQTRYVFSLKASYKNIPLSSMVLVEVLVDDTNDNSPQFNQAVYSTQIDENIRSGTYVTQVFAQDNDGSKENSKITYRILQETLVPFSIDFQGVIAVDGSIDREKKNEYDFDIIAVDSGIVQRSSKAKVKISIADLNDNAPIISEYNTSIILQEGKLPGTEILKLSISDLDTSKNGPPFVCSLFGGDSSIFEILTEKNNCVLRSKISFIAKEHPQHQLIIRVSDSGFPKQYSDSNVKIMVVKESYNSPVIQEPKVFFVIVSKPYGVTLIGKVSVFDKDENDIHQYRLTGGTKLDYFSIQPMTGVIEGKPKKGVYTLSVEVTDGRNSDASLLQIIVNERDHDVETKSIVITVHGMDVQEFISKMTHFLKILAKITGNSMENIFLWSIKGETNSTSSLRKRKSIENKVSVAVAVKMEDNMSYMDIQLLKKYVEENTVEFKNNDLDISVSSIECNELKACGENMKCLVKLIPVENLSPFIPSGYMGFQRTEKCYCNDGTEASVCQSVNLCLRNPCKNGEKCVATRNSYYCECVNPEKCGQGDESITLNGNSYIEYKLSKSFDELFHTLSLYFRTEYKDGYLVYAYAPAKDYFIVEIQEGHIQVRFDFGSGYVQKKIEEVKINDGDWHFVSIQRNGNRVIMSLDFNKYNLDVKAQGNSANINIDGRPIIIGSGLTDNANATFSGFTGCIKEPKLNKKLLPFMGITEIVSRVSLHNTESGCKDSGLCSVKHCPKFSDCFNTFTSHRCVCLTGHHGLSCMSNLTCEDRPCKNDGICTYERVGNVVSYVCTCKFGFTGGQCHIALGECASNPCKNNGVCLPSSTDLGYTCSCVKGFSGKLCEINENPCLSNPCFNGGICQNIDYDFKCTCPSGKSGRQCSAGQHCLVSRCENGGSCFEKNDNAVCQCREGFVGDRCQEDVNECLKDVCHSNDVCINIPGSFYCNCTNGLLCSLKSIYPERKQFSLMLIFFGVCGTLLLVIIVVGIIYCKRRYHLRYHPTPPGTEMHKYSFKYETEDLYPPSPPPRGVSVLPGYYDENDQASAAMYEPSLVTFSGTSSPDEKIPFKNDSSRTSVEYNSEEELHGYHWDYSGVPEDVIKSKMSREGSRLGISTNLSYGGDFVDLPKLPVRPASRRSSLPGCSESENDIPKLPELPQQIRLSRLSLKSSNQSPSYLRRPPDRAPPIEENRYSMRSDDTDNEDYLQEYLENETNSSDITNVTRPYTKPVSLFERAKSEISDISEDFDGYTVTSLNSNDEDDEAGELDPLDPENTRKLEREIKRLFKDIQKRTEDN